MSGWVLAGDDLTAAPVRELGGKGAGLRDLVAAGAPVPPFVVVGASTFREIAAPAELPALLGRYEFELVDLAEAPTQERDASATRWSARLVEATMALPLDRLTDELGAVAGLLGDGPVAVRSSMVGEDSAAASFAGQLWTAVGVEPSADAIAAAVRRCWASAFSPHALIYARAAELAPTEVRVAVVVQQMVDAARSGVLFTADPRTGERDVAVVAAVHGLGEGVVAGLVDGDEYRVRAGREIGASTGAATHRVVGTGDGGTEVVELAPELVGRRVLTATEVVDVADWGRRLQHRFGRTLDVEFSFDLRGVLHLLQARPITASAPPPEPEDSGAQTWLWDDANIQESFCGVTLPLTFSFASRAYTRVYRSLGDLLGVGEQVERDHADMLRTMIGLLDGRVYYNLNAWFEGLSLLPSSGTNKADMERMMGVEEPVPFVVDQRGTALGTALMVARLLPAAVRLAPSYLGLDRGIVAFDERLAHLERSVDRDHLRRATIGQCLDLETRVWAEVLDRWRVPIVNDIRVMRTSGALRRLVESATDDPDRRDRLEVELLGAIDGLASVEPTLELMRIAAHLRARPELAERFAVGEATAALADVRAADPEIDRRVAAYLDAYGGRCMGELKLETVTPRRDPTFLVDVIRSYLDRPDLDPDRLAADESVRHRAALEELVELVGPRGRDRALRTVAAARTAIAAREHLRLARTRVFDLVRELYTTIGERLAEAGVLEHPRDVFFLTTDEVRGFHEGTAVTTDLAGLVELRRREFAAFEQRDPGHRIATRGTVHLTPTFAAPPMAVDEGATTWHGLGCCPGVVEGEAVVVTDPSMAGETAGRIVIAVRTDPGWAPLFPTALGLVVERGSALSHSAVIAREVGLPTVVGAPGVTARIRSGDRVRVDGGAGVVTVVDREQIDDACADS